jgi:hypothetical protein
MPERPTMLKHDRVYYWTWQACSLVAGVGMAAFVYLILHLVDGGDDGFFTGAMCGIAFSQVVNATRWRDR